jgi:hypothetical protein
MSTPNCSWRVPRHRNTNRWWHTIAVILSLERFCVDNLRCFAVARLLLPDDHAHVGRNALHVRVHACSGMTSEHASTLLTGAAPAVRVHSRHARLKAIRVNAPIGMLSAV